MSSAKHRMEYYLMHSKKLTDEKRIWDQFVFPDRNRIVGLSTKYDEKDYRYDYLNDEQKRKWKSFVENKYDR